jgi:hemerythrin-like domain-containing protein
MSKELISARMLKEHGKMLKLLNDFMKNKRDAFEKLQDMQEKHAFAEEKAIFIFYRDKKDLKLLSTILSQHEQLKEYMSQMQTSKEAAEKFEKLMKEHIKLEDSKFYPMLDKDLTPEQQKRMMEQFEILIG